MAGRTRMRGYGFYIDQGLPYVVIWGHGEERLRNAIQAVYELLHGPLKPVA